MADVKHQVRELIRKGESLDALNRFVMGRENKVITKGLLLQMSITMALNKIKRSSKNFKVASTWLIDGLEQIKKGMEKGRDEAKEKEKLLGELKPQIKKWLKAEEKEPLDFQNILNSFMTIESNESAERATFLEFLKIIEAEGFDDDKLMASLDDLDKETKIRIEDLKQMEAFYANFIGEIEGHTYNETIINMKNLFKTGNIHSWWFTIPIYSRLKQKLRARNVARKYPKKFYKALHDAVVQENAGSVHGVDIDNHKILEIFSEEDHNFEDMQARMNKVIDKFIREDYTVRDDIKHALNEVNRSDRELYDLMIKLRRISENNIIKFEKVLTNMRRGTEIHLSQIRAILTHVENLIVKLKSKRGNNPQGI